MDGAKKVDGGLVVTCGDGPILLQPSKEVLDQMAGLVQMSVIVTLYGTSPQTGNDHRLAGLNERCHHPSLSVASLVGDDQIGRRIPKQDIRTFQIGGLPGREVKTGGIAQRIHRGMDLCTQSTTAASDGLRTSPPFLHRHCADGHARWWHRSWRIRCLHPAPEPGTGGPTRHACSSASGADAPPESLRSARGDHARGCRRGSGKAPRPRTDGYHGQ